STEGLDRMARGLKERVALYASTPEYAEMLEMFGWSVNQEDFANLSRQNKWEEMGNLVSDEMLEAYAIITTPEDLPAALAKRYGGKVDRIQIDETWFDGLTDDQVADLVAKIKTIPGYNNG
ncbi:MAG: hypothetical protein KJZ59_09480, partial [Pararhodobacter sp.]|nr:hypothetical protein [Pararhodobacter sp.]